MERQLPDLKALGQLLQLRRARLTGPRSDIEGAQTIWDLRKLARRRTPTAVFDYTDGAADSEESLRRARELFRKLTFHPRVLRDVSEVDPSADLLGAQSSFPFALAPTGFTRMMRAEGESAVARVAERSGIPYALSTMGTTSIEQVARVAPNLRRWFQLYLWRDRQAGIEFVRRAAESGYEALILTVDVPVAGRRLRDVYNGLSVPPEITLRTFVDGALHPAWWFDLLTTEPLTFANMHHYEGTVADMIDRMFDPSATVDEVRYLRSEWPGKLIVKGVQRPEDARLVVDAGADAVVVSNHGGRQLDNAPTPLRLLGAVLAEVGRDCEVYLDGGVMHGADIVAALALGAHGVLVGRAYLYGLMAGGEKGVERAIKILASEIVRTMRLLGATSVAELDSSLVSLPEYD